MQEIRKVAVPQGTLGIDEVTTGLTVPFRSYIDLFENARGKKQPKY